MRLLVFLHGTTIMHASGFGRSRAERVAQVRRHDPAVDDFAAYVPIGGAAAKLRRWSEHGASISYLSSHVQPAAVGLDANVIHEYGFPAGPILSRQPGEHYADVVAREGPDLLIEDDCESIGRHEVAHGQLPLRSRTKIGSIIVPEFGGIDHLPDTIEELVAAARRR
jgi:hypothetical protein